MIIKFTEEEFEEASKMLAILGIDISMMGGLSKTKRTLGVNPVNVIKQIKDKRVLLENLTPVQKAVATKEVLNYLTSNFKNSMIAK